MAPLAWWSRMSAVFCPARPAVALGARFSVRLLTARPVSSERLEIQPFPTSRRRAASRHFARCLHLSKIIPRVAHLWVGEVRRGKDSDFENPVNALQRPTWKNPCGSHFQGSDPSEREVIRPNRRTHHQLLRAERARTRLIHSQFSLALWPHACAPTVRVVGLRSRRVHS